jgi:hypothetical protein
VQEWPLPCPASLAVNLSLVAAAAHVRLRRFHPLHAGFQLVHAVGKVRHVGVHQAESLIDRGKPGLDAARILAGVAGMNFLPSVQYSAE